MRIECSSTWTCITGPCSALQQNDKQVVLNEERKKWDEGRMGAADEQKGGAESITN